MSDDMDNGPEMKVDSERFAKAISSQHLALLQLLLDRGILTEGDLKQYERMIDRMFDAQEQALAEKRDRQLQQFRGIQEVQAVPEEFRLFWFWVTILVFVVFVIGIVTGVSV